MRNNLLISIIIPVYNVEPYLEKCLDSVIGQTYPNLEIILVNDGSTDNAPAICNKYAKKDSRVKVIHKENGGLSDARNVGIEKSHGKYISFIDSDDWVPKESIGYLHNLLISVDADIVSGRIKEVFSRKNVKIAAGESNYTVYSRHEALTKLMYSHNGLTNSVSGKLYNRLLFKHTNFPVGKLYEDLATTYKIFAKAEKVASVDKIVYYYYQNTDSIMHAKYTTERLQGITFAEEELEFMKKNFPDAKNAALYRLFYEHLLCLNDMPLSCIDKNDSIKFIKRYRKNILDDRSLHTKQRLLCMASYLGHPGIKLAFFFKNKLKSMR